MHEFAQVFNQGDESRHASRAEGSVEKTPAHRGEAFGLLKARCSSVGECQNREAGAGGVSEQEEGD